MKTFDRILVPVDYSAASKDALRAALVLAAQFGSEVEVLHSWMRVPGLAPGLGADVMQSLAGAAMESMRDFMKDVVVPDGVALTTRVVEGEAWPTVVELSKVVDLIVMGTHGRTGLDRMIMGSTAERVVRESECPVLTVRNQAPDVVEGAVLADEVEERVIRGMVDDGDKLRNTLSALLEAGISTEKVSVVMSEDVHENDFSALEETKAKEAAATGGIMAGTVGGILGGLAGIGSVVTTGGLALMVLGPAIGFAAVGGAVGGLLGRTVPADRARVLKAQISEGNRLIAVHVDGQAEAAKVSDIMKQNGAEILDL